MSSSKIDTTLTSFANEKNTSNKKVMGNLWMSHHFRFNFLGVVTTVQFYEAATPRYHVTVLFCRVTCSGSKPATMSIFFATARVPPEKKIFQKSDSAKSGCFTILQVFVGVYYASAICVYIIPQYFSHQIPKIRSSWDPHLPTFLLK